MTRLLAILMIPAALCGGCEPVPDIQFVADEAGSPDASARVDAGRRDADVDVDADADSGVVCEGEAPSGGTCCGQVWCLGLCDQANCDSCARAGCSPGLLCCGKNGIVQCKSKCP